jgi:hypothetical protein
VPERFARYALTLGLAPLKGKSIRGVVDLVKKPSLPPRSEALYAHLGGAGAING